MTPPGDRAEPIPPPTVLDGSGVHVLAPPEALHFYHSRTVTLAEPLTAIEGWNRMMARPLPLMGWAFKLRDAIASLFGVKRIGGFSREAKREPKAGEKLDFFLVEHASPQMLTLTERDRHLDVMTCISTEGSALTVTSSVIRHNAFGRVYMLVVAPAHRLIVWSMLRRLAAESAHRAAAHST